MSAVQFEQISLFGERDPFAIVTDFIGKMKKNSQQPFDQWLLDAFSSYWGGTIPTGYAPEEYTWFEFSPKVLRLSSVASRNSGYREIIIPKARLLRFYNVKDDRKDLMKEMDV